MGTGGAAAGAPPGPGRVSWCDAGEECAGRVGAVGLGEQRQELADLHGRALIVADKQAPGERSLLHVEWSPDYPRLGPSRAVVVRVQEPVVGRQRGPAVRGVAPEVVVRHAECAVRADLEGPRKG